MPPTPKAADALRQQKERKQKKLLLFVLLPALVIVLGIQAPRLKDLVSNAKEQTASVQSNVVEGLKEIAPTVPAETAAGAAPSDPTAAVISATAGLSDTDVPPEVDEGQLISFTRFDAQDPFVQLVAEESEETGEAVTATDTGSAATAGGGTTTTTPAPTSSQTPVPTTTPDTSTDSTGTDDVAVPQASISVNGSVVVVEVGATFPENDPAFKVVSIEGDLVKIGLASGSFSGGVDTIDLRVGDTVTLISQPDGARFQLKVVKVG